MCKSGSKWIHPLADLGFDVRLIEQTMSLADGGGHVKPDVVATSNRCLNALVFDCKGGKNVEQDQADRYRRLTQQDILRWIEIWRPERLTHDVCLFSLEGNHLDRTDKFSDFPQLILSDESLRKVGSFSNKDVDREFATTISIPKGSVAPTLYYPFSARDDPAVILPFVLRAIIAFLLDKNRGGNLQISEAMLDNTELLRRVHPLWDLISVDHQRAIREKVRDIIKMILRDYPVFAARLQGTEPHPDIPVTLSNIIELCEKMIAEEEKKTRITDYASNG